MANDRCTADTGIFSKKYKGVQYLFCPKISPLYIVAKMICQVDEQYQPYIFKTGCKLKMSEI